MVPRFFAPSRKLNRGRLRRCGVPALLSPGHHAFYPQMTRLGTVSRSIVFLLGFTASEPLLADAPPAPDFSEIFNLVRQHLSGISEPELNRAAVQGLLSELGPKVSLVGGEEEETNHQHTLVAKTSLYDGPVAYVRVRRVADGLDKDVRSAWQALGATNKLKGLVIDLRYAVGTGYGAAAATASLFARKDQPLFDWGQGMVQSQDQPEKIPLSIAVLVNEKTAGAAEALAAALRETGAGLILGTRTAGRAMIAREFPLKNGERLRIATSPIQLADGSKLSTEGLKPDIEVELSAGAERAYYADAFKEIPKPGAPGMGSSGAGVAPRARRPRFNEAELVRERRSGGIADAGSAGAAEDDSEKPVVQDPVLARALDFLKGLSVMRQPRS